MIALIFFIFSLAIGLSLLYFLRINLLFEEKTAWALVLGSVILTFSSFVFSFFGGFNREIILISFLFIFAPAIFFFLKRKERIKRNFLDDLKDFKKRLYSREALPFLIILIVFFLFFSIVWPKVFFQTDEGLFTIAIGGVWGDWAAHNTYVSHFFHSNQLSFKNPIFVGESFSYTFMADFQSALLMKLGESRILSMILPGFFYSISLIVLLFYFILRITKKRSVAVLSLFLFLFGSGLGFFYFLRDVNGMNLLEIGGYLKNSHTTFTHLADKGIHWTNFMQALLLPQRALTMGFPLAIIILSSVYKGLKENSFKLLALGGVAASFLPALHIHSLIAVSITSFFLIIFLSQQKKTFRKLTAFFFPIILLGLWQVLLLFPGGESGITFRLGWMAKEENWFYFWFKNLGGFLVLFPISFFFINKELKKIYLSFFSLFVITNLFLFQPHDYDNIKISTYWFLLTTIIISVFLIKFWKKDIAFKFLVIIFVFTMTFSTFLDVARLWTKKGYLFISQEDIKKAEIIREKTEVDSVFLTSDNHNHYLPCLTGRQIVAGYGGWLWTYGIDISERFKEIEIMFRGEERSKKLLKNYGVDYVLIGPSERSKFKANEEFYANNYSFFLKINGTKIFKVNDN